MLTVCNRASVALPIFKTITLGKYQTGYEYRRALNQAGCSVSNSANELLEIPQFICASQETEVDLVALSVGELHLDTGVHYKDMCRRALQEGIELCPAEVGPALRLTYRDQLHGECLRIAMEAISSLDHGRVIFGVMHSYGKLCLEAFYGRPGELLRATDRFLFRGRRKL